MGFAQNYEDYNYWKIHLEDTPEAWERQTALEADAAKWYDNQDDIKEALNMLYQARLWRGNPNNDASDVKVGRWFILTFGDQLGEWCFPENDDDTPF